MKKFILIIALLITVPNLWSQDGVLVKIVPKPDKVYRITMNIMDRTRVHYSGDAQTLKTLRDEGKGSPSVVKQEYGFVLDNKTGQLNKNGNIPFLAKLDSVSFASFVNSKRQVPDSASMLDTSMTITGFYDNDSMIVKNVSLDKTTPAMELVLKKMLANMSKSIKFPDSTLNIGDKFTRELPMNVSGIGRQGLNVLVRTIYTLREIRRQRAYFGLIQRMTMQGNSDNISLSLKGGGTGEAVYDLKEQQVVIYKDNVKSKETLNAGLLSMIKESDVTVDWSMNIMDSK